MNIRPVVLALVGLAASTLWGADPGIAFIGRGEIRGNLADKSGLTGNICQLGAATNCIPNTTFGGFGSAMAYTGFDNVFLAVPDRGPFDGRTVTPYLNRFHFLHLNLDTAKNPNAGALNIETTLLDTRFLRDERNRNLLGSSAAAEGGDLPASSRFDPEGVVVTQFGTFIVSDEYGPYIYEFDRDGRIVRRIPVPSKYLIANPTGEVNEPGDSLELYKFPFASGFSIYGNNYGRQANRGMEGLTITPDGRYLVGIMQNALIQDGALSYSKVQTASATPSRVGLNTRIYKYDLQTGQSWEYIYVLDGIGQGRGVNEILAINDSQFLVVERDNRSLVSPGASAFSPASSGFKRIFKIDLNTPGLTDVSAYEWLPTIFVPVRKELFIDLLSADYVVDNRTTPATPIKNVIAEKIEALAWGPDLPNGRHVLYVMSDNDLSTTFPTQVYAFEVDPSPAGANIRKVRQTTPNPMIPSVEVRKLLGTRN